MKVNEIKSKVAAKVAKGKAKVAAKCGKAAKCVVLLFGLSFVLVGCQNPAQRAQTAETRLTFNINEGASGTTFNFGNEFVSLAQSNETGGNDAGQTASPTTDTKPEIAVGVGGSSAGVGGTSGASKQGVGAAIGGAVDAVSGLFTGGASEEADDKATSAAKTEQSSAKTEQSAATDVKCEGGNCADGSCTDGSCAEDGARSDGSCSRCTLPAPL